jgi:thiol-disulfide isomerase/thioredoxin
VGAGRGGLPQVTLPCLGGGRDVDLSSLRGPMVVNLWASWCGPCRKEMPILQDFHERYDDRVQVIGIDYQDVQTQAALDLVKETGVTYPLLADPQSALSGAAPFPVLRGLPFLALVDTDGRVVHREFTIIESRRQLAGLVDRHLGIRL